MRNKKLLVVGELNVDLILNEIQGFPKVGEEIIANQMNMTLGSSSAIFASNISVLGIETAFCGKIGKDDYGDFIINRLKEKSVSTQYLSRDGALRSGITIVLNYAQDRANVTYCGAMEALGIDDLPWEEIMQFGHLHLSNLFLQPLIRKDIVELFERAKSEGLTTSLDIQTDPEGIYDFDFHACLPFVDIFFPNEAELMGMTKAETIEEALGIVKPSGRIVALKLGQKGGLVMVGDEIITAPAFLQNNFVDAIGAGDSFNAGFIHHFLQGKTLDDCLRFANLTGALNTSSAGGTGAFQHKNQVIQLAKEKFNYDISYNEA